MHRLQKPRPKSETPESPRSSSSSSSWNLKRVLFPVVVAVSLWSMLQSQKSLKSFSLTQTTERDRRIDGPSIVMNGTVTATPKQTTIGVGETPSRNATDPQTSECIPFNVASHFAPTTAYRESTKLPQWMKDYFDWHREQTLNINDCNYLDYDYLIVQCSKLEVKCGGFADRMKPLPFFVAAAARWNRVLLIRWERPTKLEEFLLPNEINWSVPDWMHKKFHSFTQGVSFAGIEKALITLLKKEEKPKVITTKLQNVVGSSARYYLLDVEMDGTKEFNQTYYDLRGDQTGWWDIYPIIFHDIFFTVFRPSPPIEKLVQEKLAGANLVPGQFSASHYRAFYAKEHNKSLVSEEEIGQKTQNALNCASKLQPGDPIFFTSDSKVAIQFAHNESKSKGRQIVVFEDEEEALHIDKMNLWTSGNIEDFYPTFVDLFFMSKARCIALSKGQFGNFANMLSSAPKCLLYHDHNRYGKRCKWTELDPKDDSTEMITPISSNATDPQTSECIRFNVASHFAPTTAYRESTTLPQWMKDYFDWHREQTLNINDCNYLDYDYLIIRCSKQEAKCGGFADRMKPLPFFVAAAARWNRVLLIRWERPTKLEEFLLPNEINWSVPDWMYKKSQNFTSGTKYKPKENAVKSLLEVNASKIIETQFQNVHGSSRGYYLLDVEMDDTKEFNQTYLNITGERAGWSDIYPTIFHDVFYTIFRPSPPIEKLVQEKLANANLVPGQFSASHYRVFYGTEHNKSLVSEDTITRKTRNALNCASKLQPGDPIFFASDSKLAIQFAHNESESKGHHIVVFENEQEAVHLDKMYQWTSGNIEDFYPTFVDLFFMSKARCISLSKGGFGNFANMLSSTPDCFNYHDKAFLGQHCEWTES